MNDILPSRLQGLTEAQLRKEYSRLRRNAQRRMSNLERAGFEKTNAYRLAAGRISFRPVKELTLRDLQYELYDLETFMSEETSTVRGARKESSRRIKSLQKAGYGWIQTVEDLNEFVEYMEYARSMKAERIVGSPTVAERLREWKAANKSPQEIRGELLQWLESEEKSRQRAVALSDMYRASLGEL